MKFLFALVAFLLAIGFNSQSVAAGAPDPSKPATGKGANVDWSHKRHEQVRAIFPEKTKDPKATVRPAKVQLNSPAFGTLVSGDSVTLEWTASEGALVYHVQVSKDAGFNNRSMYIAEDKFAKGTTFEVKGLEAGTQYFWRVAAVNGKQESQYTKSVFTSSKFTTAAK